MTDNTCNGWRNAATWTVNLWFGDSWVELAEEGFAITPDGCHEHVAEYVASVMGGEGALEHGFIWDMLDLSSVDWGALASHHQPETDWIA
jgi:hypothetical protein